MLHRVSPAVTHATSHFPLAHVGVVPPPEAGQLYSQLPQLLTSVEMSLQPELQRTWSERHPPGPVPDPTEEPGLVPDPMDEPGLVPDPMDEPGLVPDPTDDPGLVPEPMDEPGPVPKGGTVLPVPLPNENWHWPAPT